MFCNIAVNLAIEVEIKRNCFSLPEAVVSSPVEEVFESRLDKVWKNQGNQPVWFD